LTYLFKKRFLDSKTFFMANSLETDNTKLQIRYTSIGCLHNNHVSNLCDNVSLVIESYFLVVVMKNGFSVFRNC